MALPAKWLSLALLAGVAARLTCAVEPQGSWDPRGPGPFIAASPVHLKVGKQGPPFGLWGFLPKTPGEYPVAVFVAGFLADASAYTALLSRIASYGIAVVGVELPQLKGALENAAQRAAHLSASLDFMTSDGGVALAEGFESAGGPAGVKLDVANRLMVMAHSIGGHTLLYALEKLSCFNAKVAALLDPVDGLDPYGIRKDFLVPTGIHPEVHLNFTMPTALIMSGHGADLAPFPKILHPPSCAPRDRSDLHWFESMQAPKWLVNVTDFGHAEVIDGIYEVTSRAICPPGPGASTDEARTAYKETIAGMVVALAQTFMNVPGAPSLPLDERLRWLEDPTALAPLRATGTFDRGTQGMQAGCRHTSDALKAAERPKPALVV